MKEKVSIHKLRVGDKVMAHNTDDWFEAEVGCIHLDEGKVFLINHAHEDDGTLCETHNTSWECASREGYVRANGMHKEPLKLLKPTFIHPRLINH